MRFREFRGEIYDAGDIGKEIAKGLFPRQQIQRSLHFFEGHNGEIEQANRVEEFELAVMEINRVLGGTKEPFDPAVEQLKKLVGNRRLPLFADDLEFPETREMYRAEVAAWREAKRTFPSWAEREFRRPATAAVGMALEYYATMIGYWVKGINSNPEERKAVARAVVIAVESTLALHYGEGHMIRDVKDWMLEEKEAFSLLVQRKIERLEDGGQK
ncbi:hypothetical protein M1116_04190 [Patescibacteria group bacterium]|nr:hypothetical protein [Patescibacteria group bacterium]